MKNYVLLAMLLCILSPSALEAKRKWLGKGVYWELKNGVLTISGSGDMPNLAYYKPWYKRRKKIRIVVIKDGVTSIGFQDVQFENLSSVTIPNSIKSINSFAFGYCSNLKTINMPNGVTLIGDYAFKKSGLTSISIPESVSWIGSYAFQHCNSLASITLNKNVKVINDGAFEKCTNLTSLTLPNSVDSIGKEAFKGCGKLNIEVPYSCKKIGNNAFEGVKSVSKYITLNNEKFYVVTGEKGYFGLELPREEFVKHNYLGLKDTKGNWIIPLDEEYYEITPLPSGYLKVKKENYYGIIKLISHDFITSKGNPVLITMPPITIIPTDRCYTSISDYDKNKGTFAFTKKGYKGICDANGKEVSLTKLIPTKDEIKAIGGYASVEDMKNGGKQYWKVGKGGRYGLTDAYGKVIIPCKMDVLESAGTGYLKNKINGSWGVMDYMGNTIIAASRGYTSIDNYNSSKGGFPFTKKGYTGICDAKGKEVSLTQLTSPAVANDKSITYDYTLTYDSYKIGEKLINQKAEIKISRNGTIKVQYGTKSFSFDY